MSEQKKLKIVFEEGCFDGLVEAGGTQEEIDELTAWLTEIVASGEIENMGIPVDTDELRDEVRDMMNSKRTRH